jgi:phenylacetate-CoA ligase
MPFIRYRTGDFSCWAEGFCEHCRRPYPLLNGVRGRAQADVFDRNGHPFPYTSLAGAIHGPEFLKVQRLQFYQDTPGILELHIEAREGFGDGEARSIRHTLEQKLGTAFQLEIKVVPSIPLPARGKQTYLIQKLE